MDRYNNKIYKKKYPLGVYFIIFIFLYSLFAIGRIKVIFSFTVENMATTNEIGIILLICLFLFIYNIVKREKVSFDRYSFYLGICLLLLIIDIIIGAYNAISIQQYIYSLLILITPILLFFITSKLDMKSIAFLCKIFVVTCMGYSIFAIILSTNYAFFMGLLGNPIEAYSNYSQIRPSMMLGTSITVSYYFNITLPFCFYMFYNSNQKIWVRISAISIGANIVATLILLSRAATFVMVLTVSYYLFFIDKRKKSFKMKITLIILLIIAGIIVANKYDLTRLAIGLDKTDNSVNARLEASRLGLSIFNEYPIFGSGMGRFFERIYDNRYITVNGITGLVDPHNMYILALSETGIIGFVLIGTIFLVLFNSFSFIRQKSLRKSSYITIISLLICSIGGSHLINEISFSIVFWIYMGVFNAISIKDRELIKDTYRRY